MLADLEAGKVDLIIGTHRLLSKDVHFKKLGLLVVDGAGHFLGASQRDALALRARGHVEAHFSLPKMCAQTLEIYAALLEGRRPQPIA